MNPPLPVILGLEGGCPRSRIVARVSVGAPGIRGLFQQRVDGDDALLRLAALRFAQAGMPAELYAASPDELERLLPFVPEHDTLPTVHLDRRLSLLTEPGRQAVRTFVERFRGRVAGFVVHDQPDMRHRMPDLLAGMAQVGDRADGPFVFLEYAARHPLEWFVEVARRAAGFERAGMCVDIGHVGRAAAGDVVRDLLGPARPGRPLLTDPDLAELVDVVEQGNRAGLPAVLATVEQLGEIGRTVHFHLHDAHPAVPGLADHFGFLTRFPIRFEHRGRRSLPPMFGPEGLAAVLAAADRALGPDRLSLTLEIHQIEGRLPLDPEAAALFAHWADLSGPETLNQWLAVVAQNQQLAVATQARVAAAVPAAPAAAT